MKQEGLDIRSVRLLTECDLKLLGVSKMGPRKILLEAIRRLRGTPRTILLPRNARRFLLGADWVGVKAMRAMTRSSTSPAVATAQTTPLLSAKSLPKSRRYALSLYEGYTTKNEKKKKEILGLFGAGPAAAGGDWPE
jgi:hypothetical protein